MNGPTHGPRFTAQAWGFAAFKTVARFIITTAAFTLPSPTGGAVVILLIASELSVQSVIVATQAYSVDIRDKAWLDTLANRTFYELLFDRVRAKDYVDVKQLFREAQKLAVEDIVFYHNERLDPLEISGWRKFFIGSGTFFSNVVGYAFGYGLPWLIGSILISR